jgi:hypothetical protein
MDKTMTFTIKVKGDVQKIMPAVIKTLENERKRLAKRGVRYSVERTISDV